MQTFFHISFWNIRIQTYISYMSDASEINGKYLEIRDAINIKLIPNFPLLAINSQLFNIYILSILNPYIMCLSED